MSSLVFTALAPYIIFFYYSLANVTFFDELDDTSLPTCIADCDIDDVERDAFLRRRRVVKSMGNEV